MDSGVTKTVKGLPHNNTWAELFVHRLPLIQDLNRIKCVCFFFVNDFVDFEVGRCHNWRTKYTNRKLHLKVVKLKSKFTLYIILD